jgi:hypothetical protein
MFLINLLFFNHFTSLWLTELMEKLVVDICVNSQYNFIL